MFIELLYDYPHSIRYRVYYIKRGKPLKTVIVQSHTHRCRGRVAIIKYEVCRGGMMENFKTIDLKMWHRSDFKPKLKGKDLLDKIGILGKVEMSCHSDDFIGTGIYDDMEFESVEDFIDTIKEGIADFLYTQMKYKYYEPRITYTVVAD